MKKELIIFSILVNASSLSAQQTFTQHLTRRVAGEGTVTLHHDAEIDALVNGITRATASSAAAPAANNAAATRVAKAAKADTVATDSTLNTLNTFGRRIRANGYRIQVYAGGNNRQAKSEAYRMAALVRSNFDDVQVYTHFISPRWICRVGDFKTYEEASDMLRRMRDTQKFREASIVKSKIIIQY